MSKRERHERMLELVRDHRIRSQEEFRALLAAEGLEVTQATLSRDIRELRLIKVPDAQGQAHYTLPPDVWGHSPPLQRLLPTLFVDLDGAGNLLVVKTLAGGAQPVASAIDGEEWPEVLGTVAGDDTILLILRAEDQRDEIEARIKGLAGVEDGG